MRSSNVQIRILWRAIRLGVPRPLPQKVISNPEGPLQNTYQDIILPVLGQNWNRQVGY
jgi:hypothetical protein